MRENAVFLVIFDTCDVMFNWLISLLPPLVYLNILDHQTMVQKETVVSWESNSLYRARVFKNHATVPLMSKNLLWLSYNNYWKLFLS